MADTAAAPTNQTVAYQGRKKVPSVSKAQNAAMHAAAEGKSTIGIPQSVGREYVADQAPGSVAGLPEHVRAAKALKVSADKMHAQGLITGEHHAKVRAKADAAMKKGMPAPKSGRTNVGPR